MARKALSLSLFITKFALESVVLGVDFGNGLIESWSDVFAMFVTLH